MEKVTSIREVENVRIHSGWGSYYDGYEVETTEHKYMVLINNDQQCCESWGYFSSNNDLDDYIDKELVEIQLTDTALNTEVVKHSGYYEDDGGIQFVDFRFSDGDKLQLAVYNAHNGYYGHGIYVVKDDEIVYDGYL